MNHICTLLPDADSLTNLIKKNFCTRCRQYTLINPKNPLCVNVFRSEKAIKMEMKRQLREGSWYTIHPMSKFRAWYEVYLLFLYSANLVMKPFLSGFVMRGTGMTTLFCILIWCLDFLNYIDIIMFLVTGYTTRKSNSVELRPLRIVWNYLYSIYFFSDFVTAIPRLFWFSNYTLFPTWWFGLLSILYYLKLIRLGTLLSCLRRTTGYFRWSIKDKLFLINAFIISLVAVHYVTCLKCMIPMFGYCFWFDKSKQEEYRTRIENIPKMTQYKTYVLITGAQILGVHVEQNVPFFEDYILSMFTFAFGKVLMTFLWIILALNIMTRRSMEIKFVEVVNQLDTYMTQRGFPINLRKKLENYYEFKFQGKYFKEKQIYELLSTELQNEVNLHVRRSLIEKVSIFSSMTSEQIAALVPKLDSEIYLPNETIYRAADDTEYMYFVASGTVAVYTRSGKEVLPNKTRVSRMIITDSALNMTYCVCHIQEGGYLNEIALLLKTSKNLCTAVSIEMTEIYRLSKKDFDKYIAKYPEVYAKVLQQAKLKFAYIKIKEKQYRKEQFESKFGKAAATHDDLSRHSSVESIMDISHLEKSELSLHLGKIDGWIGVCEEDK